jgi:hypothetical protein
MAENGLSLSAESATVFASIDFPNESEVYDVCSN